MVKIAGRRYRSLATTEWHHVPDLMSRAVNQMNDALNQRLQGDGAQAQPARVHQQEHRGVEPDQDLRRERCPAGPRI